MFQDQYDGFFEEAKRMVVDLASASGNAGIAELQDSIRGSLRHYFRRVLGRDPIVVPVISEV